MTGRMHARRKQQLAAPDSASGGWLALQLGSILGFHYDAPPPPTLPAKSISAMQTPNDSQQGQQCLFGDSSSSMPG
jgi:hypothetical protein